MEKDVAEMGMGDDGQIVRWRWRIEASPPLAGGLGAEVVHVVDHGDEEVEEELAAGFHLVLHRAAALEGVARADDEGEVVRPELGVAVGRVGVRIACRGQDGRALDAGLETLLAEGELLQLLEPVPLSLAVDDGVLEDGSRGGLDSGLAGRRTAIFQAPCLTLAVVLQPRVVVALVEVLKDGREDFRVLVGKVDPLVSAGEELVPAGVLEVRRVAEDVLVSSEQTLLVANCYGDDSTDASSVTMHQMGSRWGLVLTFRWLAMSDWTRATEL